MQLDFCPPDPAYGYWWTYWWTNTDVNLSPLKLLRYHELNIFFLRIQLMNIIWYSMIFYLLIFSRILVFILGSIFFWWQLSFNARESLILSRTDLHQVLMKREHNYWTKQLTREQKEKRKILCACAVFLEQQKTFHGECRSDEVLEQARLSWTMALMFINVFLSFTVGGKYNALQKPL